MDKNIISISENKLQTNSLIAIAGQAANQAAAKGIFTDYASRKARNTLRRHRSDLTAFESFLVGVGLIPGDLQGDPDAWHGVTWGLVAAFQKSQLAAGYAVTTVNFRISTVKIYSGLAALAGALDKNELSMIRLVNGYSRKEGKRIDQSRLDYGSSTRKGVKKEESISISPQQAGALKKQPDTPQGRRDNLLMCLLLDHGLRCGEVAGLKIEDIDLKDGELRFYRPKVDKTQIHRLTRSTMAAAHAYISEDQSIDKGKLLLGSRKGGHLSGGMSERAITKRVATLGEEVGLSGLSAHDCRHYWATQAARHGTPLDRLQDAGGWSSMAMPGRYIEAAKIANQDVNLGDD